MARPGADSGPRVPVREPLRSRVRQRYRRSVDRLFFDGRETEIVVASQTKAGAVIATPVVEGLTTALKDGGFDVFEPPLLFRLGEDKRAHAADFAELVLVACDAHVGARSAVRHVAVVRSGRRGGRLVGVARFGYCFAAASISARSFSTDPSPISSAAGRSGARARS